VKCGRRRLLSIILVFTACWTAACSSATTTMTLLPTAASTAATTAPTTVQTTLPPTTIWLGALMVMGLHENMYTFINYFNEHNPDQITVKEHPYKSHPDYVDKATYEYYQSISPDVVIDVAPFDGRFSNLYQPIDDIWDNTVLNKADFFPDVLQKLTRDSHLYGIPCMIGGDYLLWNKTLFAQAGLDTNQAPKTWDDLLAYAKMIRQLGESISGIGLMENGTTEFTNCAISNGGRLIEETAGGSLQAVLTDARYRSGNLRALTIWQELAKLQSHDQDRFDPAGAFENGACGMVFGGAYFIRQFQRYMGHLGVGLLPAGSQGTCQSDYLYPISLMICKGTSEIEKKACYRFMAYWCDNISKTYSWGPPAYILSETGFEQPYLLSVETELLQQENPIYQVMAQSRQYLTLPYPVRFTKPLELYVQVLRPMLEQVCTGKATPEEALDQGQAKLAEIIVAMQANT
jgi:multiple sugar transport system substrate-binding protein